MYNENLPPLINLGKYIIHVNSEPGTIVAYKNGKRVMEDVDLFQLLVDLHVKERLKRLYLPSSIPILVYVFFLFFHCKKRNEFVFMKNIELLRKGKNKVSFRLRAPK
jgi:hypothetical protein